jgi:hypothetical protein
MKNIIVNKKKTITSLVSFIIIAGMAIQSLATNVDMAAFVKKDTYMSKYYELDYRIDDIEAELERLYKFVCTNVVSYHGAGADTVLTGRIFLRKNQTQTYHWSSYPIVDLSEEGYLRVNHMDQLQSFGSHPKNDTFVKEFPASLCKWGNGFEVKPETKVRIKATRGVGTGSGISWACSYSYELVMGPFKKIPYITTTGATNGFIMSTQQALAIAPTSYTPYYAYGTETEPTSWSSLGGSVYYGNTIFDTNDVSKYDYDVANYSYNKYDKSGTSCKIYVNSALTTDPSSRTNVWLRLSGSGTGDLINLNTSDPTLTTWNYNK